MNNTNLKIMFHFGQCEKYSVVNLTIKDFVLHFVFEAYKKFMKYSNL